MSYYPPHGHGNANATPSATTYPYAGYSQTGTYQYQPYGSSYASWSYGYGYYQQQQTPQQQQLLQQLQQEQQQASTSAPRTTAPTAIQPAPIVAAPPLSARAPSSSTYSFSTYSRDQNPYGRNSKKGSSYRGLFTKELRNLMYGFGDDRNPASDTVNVMEELLIEYIVDVCQTASGGGKKTRLSIEDIRRALSRTPDAKKLARMEELLFMQEDIKRARAQFNENDMQSGETEG